MIAPVLSYRMVTVVLDTNVLVAALLRGGGTGRAVVRECLRGRYQPVLGPALLAERPRHTAPAQAVLHFRRDAVMSMNGREEARPAQA